MRSFFDTNVLAYTDDAGEPDKQATALKLHATSHQRGQGVVSMQVLQEYFLTATRKMGVDPVIARRKLELLSRMNVVVNQVDDVIAAVDLARPIPCRSGTRSSCGRLSVRNAACSTRRTCRTAGG